MPGYPSLQDRRPQGAPVTGTPSARNLTHTVFLATLEDTMLAVTDSSMSMDLDVLRALVDVFDAGANLVEPSELVLRSHRSVEDVERALAGMRHHRPELLRAIYAEGRVVAVTGVTAAGRHLARTWSSADEALTRPTQGRGAILRRQSLRILIGAAVAAVVRVMVDHLPPRD